MLIRTESIAIKVFESGLVACVCTHYLAERHFMRDNNKVQSILRDYVDLSRVSPEAHPNASFITKARGTP